MALSYVDYDGDGSTTDFNVTFPYLSRDDVHALVSEVEVSYTWLSDSQIRLDAAAAIGVANLRIKRQTPTDARLVEFQDGATLPADDLNTDSTQLFYLLQELIEGTVSVTVSTDTNAAVITDHFSSSGDFTPGSTTTLTLSALAGSEDNTWITFNGVVQHKSTYSLTDLVVTFSSAIPLGVTEVEVVQFPTTQFFYATLANNSVTTSKIADLAVTTAKINDLGVTTGKIAAAAITTAKIADGSVTLAKLDASALASLLPIGVVLPYAGTAAPDSNWLVCNGAAISRSTYATLFGLIGTAYGTGNGTTTFNIPDQRGRAPIGAGTGSGLTARTQGTNYGEESHTLTKAEIPPHVHTLRGHSTAGGSSGYDEAAPTSATGTGDGSADGVGNGSGAATAHNVMQPSLPHTFIIKVL